VSDAAARRAWIDACYPLSFDAATPDAETADYLADPSIAALVSFFRTKGLAALKAEDRDETWYEDWIHFQAKHGLYASLLSPRRLSSRGSDFDVRRLTRFMEVIAYFSPSHAYSLQVSFLGIFPILTGSNEALKREAVAKLEDGGLFAFAVSEKRHGSDLFANEFTVRPDGAGAWIADGDKYYIGNANAACMVSVLAQVADSAAAPTTRAPFAFVAIRPQQSPGYRNVTKIRTLGIRAAFVGSFEVRGHALPDSDLISKGRDAWDAVFRTVDLGKFLLGFGVVGMCERAMTEAVAHMRNRVLYGRPVSEMPHIRATTAIAFARLVAMKMYATRALEYLQAACREDRRYLLFNAVQKARVSTEGVKVLALLSECIGARGVEAETYFETALRDAQLVPGLEGSTHINFGLAAQFVGPYFAGPRDGDPAPVLPPVLDASPGENPYLLETRNRNAKTVRFAQPLAAYGALPPLPNVRAFVRQAEAFGRFAAGAASGHEHGSDDEVLLATGKCFSVIAYAQLVAEKCAAVSAPPPIVSLAFHALVEDLSAEALRLSAMLVTRGLPHGGLARVVRIPRTTAADFAALDESIAARYAGR
jgi:acyl-CoA dehydrogenase